MREFVSRGTVAASIDVWIRSLEEVIDVHTNAIVPIYSDLHMQSNDTRTITHAAGQQNTN